jgi:hypothetical protein
MSLPQIQSNAIQALIQRLAGAAVIVTWSNEPQLYDGSSGLDSNGVPTGVVLPFATVAAGAYPCRIDLDIVTTTGRGVDEKVRTYVPESSAGAGDDKQTVKISGIRHTTLTIKVIADLLPTAMDVIERIRTSIALPSSLKELRAAGIALRKLDVCRSVGVPDRDGRAVDCMTLDVWLAFNSVVADDIGETDYDPAYPRTKDNFITGVSITGFGMTSAPAGTAVGIRWGVSSLDSGYDATFVRALVGALPAFTLAPDVAFEAGTDKYCFVWIPDYFSPVVFTWDAHTVTLDLVATLTVQGVAGKLYRTNVGLGALTLGVSR